MGDLAISKRLSLLAWLIAGVIVALNAKLLFDVLRG
jgi:Mn2+/Fe2+ NRAMP family transporter